GVMVEHRSITNLNTKFVDDFKAGSRDKHIRFSDISFDASLLDTFMSLLNGAALHIIDRATIDDYSMFQAYLTKHSITIASLTPPYANNLEPGKLQSLRMLMTGGSAPNLEFMKKMSRQLEYINAFGPTESTICCSFWSSREAGEFDTVSIGKPIANTQLYITNPNLKPQPIGIAGQLCIAGVGLARGYLNNPELTAKRFVKASWQKEKKEEHGRHGMVRKTRKVLETNNTLYLTGDLARRLDDGKIEFLGRIDHQVKIRGFRIELEEIENRLLSHPEIIEAVVLARQSGDDDHYLCAYYVAEDNQPPASGTREHTTALKNYLALFLPGYMIPTYFINLEKIPLTPSGKIDRKALAHIQTTKPETQTYTAPRDEIEKKLSSIWTEILGDQEQGISIDDNFFGIGGHSLRATVMMSKIHKELNVKLTLPEIFKKSSIRALSDTIKKVEKDKYHPVEPVEKKEYYILSSAQKRLYILQQMEQESIAYNMPMTIPLADRVNLTKLEDTFKKLIHRHESLRTTFHPVTPGGVRPVTPNNQTPITGNTFSLVQEVHDTVEFELDYYDYNPGKGDKDSKAGEMRTLDDVRTAFFRPFNLAKAPLLRVGIVELIRNNTAKPVPEIPGAPDDRDRVMLIDMHHIITDGTSQDILIKEFNRLNKGENLPPLELQYKDYAEWQNSPVHKQLMKQQETFWIDRFSGELPVLELPTDYPRPLVQSFEGNHITFELTEKETGTLNEIAKGNETTLYMAILAIFTVLLAKLSGQEDIIVGTPTAGRRHADLENIIGMFVNT
ncbi:MAG: AMP-binding protein, partial [bacterium]|nr:AMP-binding protein [bacterium]